ncbi:MAG: MotA/TolQ/ExbB proton channel family protein, partial [Muribaculaceae bacterium]|nr:MotA/TolQ/ExbB proton channel family protein [Muribaculaceae bacterium]
MESQKPMAPKPAVAAAVKKEEKISNIRGIKNAFFVIIACAIAAVCIFLFGMGYSGNFEGGDPATGHPLNLAGTVYK